MKLYATITNSNKKDEGVGDNLQIIATFKHGNKLVGEILFQNIDGYYRLSYGDKNDGAGMFPVLLAENLPKGKKQKGEI